MPFNISEVFNGSAALLNDGEKTQFTNAIQLPYLKIAYSQLKQELIDNNIPVSNKTSTQVTITTSMFDIGGTTGPALPLDFIEPLDLHERTAGTNDDFLLMLRVLALPMTNVLTPFLQVWSYQSQIIKFLGATASVDVKMNYIGDPLSGLVDENTQVRVFNTENFLKFRNAALCALYIGENPDRAASLNAEAVGAMDLLLNITIKSAQSIYTRRRPFRARAKTNGWGSNGW